MRDPLIPPPFLLGKLLQLAGGRVWQTDERPSLLHAVRSVRLASLLGRGAVGSGLRLLQTGASLAGLDLLLLCIILFNIVVVVVVVVK